MYNLVDIQKSFPELQNVVPIGNTSGQKDVFKARNADVSVVLKIIKQDEDNEEELNREIKAVSVLQADFVPKIFDYGSKIIWGEERFYVIEEYIEGSTLRNILIKTPKLNYDRILSLGNDLLSACVLFERKNLVHRDIKPENLIIDKRESLWVIDFGIVRLLDQESRTATNSKWGRFTPGYGAPEQMRNIKPEINSRADLYSVGIILDEAIRGYNFYCYKASNVFEVIKNVETINIPMLTDDLLKNRNLAQFITALAARYPMRRPQTANEALEWFRSVI